MLKSLASKWEDIDDANSLWVIPLKGAMTNEVFQIKWPTKTQNMSRKVVVRIYGEGVEVFFDRDTEILTFEFMSKQGQGPRLLGRFSNGRIEEFIHARVLWRSPLTVSLLPWILNACCFIKLSWFKRLAVELIKWSVLKESNTTSILLLVFFDSLFNFNLHF